MAVLEWITQAIDSHPLLTATVCAALCFYIYNESKASRCVLDLYERLTASLRLTCVTYRPLDTRIQSSRSSMHTAITQML